ncbi:MAG: hypothetical protein HZA92_04820, partial [Verrucomicrobia bacterium]|nr:hypothetical protein [Verrucomicrobiota bacterium]
MRPIRETNAGQHAATLLALAFLLLMASPSARAQEKKSPTMPAAGFVLVLHGGAGVIPKEDLTPEKEKAARATMEAALLAGHSVL